MAHSFYAFLAPPIVVGVLLTCQSLDREYKTTAFFQMYFHEKNIVLYSGQYGNLHTYLFLKCWKVFKRTILHSCSTTASESRKRINARKHSKWVFIMAAAGMQYNFKMCIINRYIIRIIIYNYSASIFLFLEI